MAADSVREFDYTGYLISHYGILLDVDEVASVFRYSSGECVRKAHAAGRLPVSLGQFPERRGLFVTAVEVANALRSFEHSSQFNRRNRDDLVGI
jgi:hypothetical protein